MYIEGCVRCAYRCVCEVYIQVCEVVVVHDVGSWFIQVCEVYMEGVCEVCIQV